MDQNPQQPGKQDYGKLAPTAPPELSRFAFLIGQWRCAARIEAAPGEWQKYEAAWLGRYILDGHAIADEYRMFGPSKGLLVLGMNLRTYNAATQTWNIRWLNAFDGNWTNLVSEELGGVHFDGQSVTYAFREPVAAHAYTRATYTPHSATHFTWRGEKSNDAKTWTEFMVVESYKTEE